MRCDECRFWECQFTDFGECTIKMGDKVDFNVYSDGYTEKEVETDADFFCAAFEDKDDE